MMSKEKNNEQNPGVSARAAHNIAKQMRKEAKGTVVNQADESNIKNKKQTPTVQCKVEVDMSQAMKDMDTLKDSLAGAEKQAKDTMLLIHALAASQGAATFDKEAGQIMVPQSADPNRPTALEAEMLLNEWQTRLGLQDYAIVLRIDCSEDEMPDAAGDVKNSELHRAATIRICHADADPDAADRIIAFDFEKTLVHELLHVKMSFLCDEDEAGWIISRPVHQLIDDLARAFVMAKRGERYRKLALPMVESRKAKEE